MKKFIALLALTLSLTAMADTNYSCFGTEPFWSLRIEGENAIFSDFQTSSVEQVASRTSAAGVGEDFAFILTTADSSTASVMAGACSDGMSDNEYTHQILLKHGDAVLYGCCNEIKK